MDKKFKTINNKKLSLKPQLKPCNICNTNITIIQQLNEQITNLKQQNDLLIKNQLEINNTTTDEIITNDLQQLKDNLNDLEKMNFEHITTIYEIETPRDNIHNEKINEIHNKQEAILTRKFTPVLELAPSIRRNNSLIISRKPVTTPPPEIRRYNSSIIKYQPKPVAQTSVNSPVLKKRPLTVSKAPNITQSKTKKF